MLINLKEYFRPESLSQARQLLVSGAGRYFVLAGGTGLVGWDNPAVEGVVDLAGLGLDVVSQDGGGLHLGAMTPLQQLIDDPRAAGYASGILAAGARSSSVSRMIRNAATVGGELATGDPYSALTAALLALDAEVVLQTNGTERLPAAEFATRREHWLSRPALIAGIDIPARSPASGADLQRLATLPSSVPILAVASSVQRLKGRATRVRIAAAGAFAGPARLTALEQLLEGEALDTHRLESLADVAMQLADPPADIRASSEYRRRVLPVLIRRSLMSCWRRAGERA